MNAIISDQFHNCLQEARYAWEMGDFRTAELRASEASVIASLERKIQELETNKKADMDVSA